MKCVYIFLAAGVSLLVRELVGSVIRMSKNGKSLGGVVQIVNYVIYVVVGVIILAVLTDKNPVKLVAGLGASAAIVSLVFKDSIQSLVAGVQLLANDMLSVGDWIVVPKANANGRVIAIHLNTVKIRNWDNTVTTVPPSTLLSDSFTSWQDMLEGKGRRISRSLCIDMASVRFLTKEEIEKYDKMPELYVFLQSSREPQEITNITNLTLFRHYMYQHLLNDSQIHLPYFGADEEMKEATEATSESGEDVKEATVATEESEEEEKRREKERSETKMRVMVRYLQPTQYGLPVELYCFTMNKNWEAHEEVIAELTEHMLGVMQRFDLRPYQVVSGNVEKGEWARKAGA